MAACQRACRSSVSRRAAVARDSISRSTEAIKSSMETRLPSRQWVRVAVARREQPRVREDDSVMASA
jgi:hypothetical protein